MFSSVYHEVYGLNVGSSLPAMSEDNKATSLESEGERYFIYIYIGGTTKHTLSYSRYNNEPSERGIT